MAVAVDAAGFGLGISDGVWDCVVLWGFTRVHAYLPTYHPYFECWSEVLRPLFSREHDK